MSFTDDFVGTNGQALESRTSWSILGSTFSGRFRVYNNHLERYDAGGTYGATLFEADYAVTKTASRYIEATLGSQYDSDGRNTFLIAVQNPDNWIGFRVVGTGSNGVRLVRRIAGAQTDDLDVICQPGSGITIRLEVTDNGVVELFRNGVSQGSKDYSTHFDAITHSNRVGLRPSPDSVVADQQQISSFSAGALTAVISLAPVVSPLYYGATLLASKSNIEYTIRDGHSGSGGLQGELLAGGIDATTDAFGNLTLPAPVGVGAAADPVTLSLYWEEGNPAIDRSLIVKTTLVAA